MSKVLFAPSLVRSQSFCPVSVYSITTYNLTYTSQINHLLIWSVVDLSKFSSRHLPHCSNSERKRKTILEP